MAAARKTAGGDTEKNTPITWRDIYYELNKQSEERLAMERRLSDKIDALQKCMPDSALINKINERAESAHSRIDDLQKTDRSWNIINGVGVIIATAVASIFGLNK